MTTRLGSATPDGQPAPLAALAARSGIGVAVQKVRDLVQRLEQPPRSHRWSSVHLLAVSIRCTLYPAAGERANDACGSDGAVHILERGDERRGQPRCWT